jgi:hypothetical protein
MSRSKHPLSGHEPDPLPADDLTCNPGIGASRGTTAGGGEPEDIEGENTFEGDVANDAGLGGGVSRQRGRTNR